MLKGKSNLKIPSPVENFKWGNTLALGLGAVRPKKRVRVREENLREKRSLIKQIFLLTNST